MRRKIALEDRQYDATIAGLIEPICDRFRRFPHRSLRQDMLVRLVRDWMHMPCRDWRLDLSARLDKGRAVLTEHRLVSGVMRPRDQPGWTGHEDDIAAIQVELSVDRSDARISSRCTTLFSLHAIGRRLQRAADGSTEALLHDMALAAGAASGELVEGAGYKVSTPDGGWRGRAIGLTQPGGQHCTALSIRTWMAAD